MAEDDGDPILAGTVEGMFLVGREAIPHLRESEGTIDNVASRAGELGAAVPAHYCVSKHAVLGLTKSLSLELASEVTVNAICPGIE